MKKLSVLLITLCFFGCKCNEVVTHSEYKAEHILKLTPVVLPMESASASAILECSKEGLVLLSRLNIETSRNAKMALMIDSLNRLTVDALVERDTIWLQSDSIIITKEVLRSEIEYREKALSGWQNFRIWAGNISIILIIIILVYLFLKFKFI